MNLAREPIFSALFALLAAVPGLQTTSRVLVNVQDVAPEGLPAAYQIQGRQSVRKATNLPPRYEMEASWIFYVLSNNTAVAPSTILNPILDAAVTALTPGPQQGPLTLGGLVTECAIDGVIEVIEGVLGDRAVAVIPIRLIAAGF